MPRDEHDSRLSCDEHVGVIDCLKLFPAPTTYRVVRRVTGLRSTTFSVVYDRLTRDDALEIADALDANTPPDTRHAVQSETIHTGWIANAFD